MRLKRSREFDVVFRGGKVAADKLLVVHAIRDEAPQTRLGLSVSKKVGHAPLRNRWKRLIREAFRRQQAELPSHLWLVVRPRRGAPAPDYFAVEASLRTLCQRVDRQL